MTKYKLGKFAGLSISARPPAITGSILLFVVFIGVAIGFLSLPIGAAIVGSLMAVVLHWAAVLAHQLGHAWVARQTGYPMIGLRLGSLAFLGTSLYPHDEPALPAAVHIRRALGGPAGSLLASLVAGLIALLLRNSDGISWRLAAFFALDNFLVLPLDLSYLWGLRMGAR